MFVGINGVFALNSGADKLNTVKSDQQTYAVGSVETVEILSQENRVLILTRNPAKSDCLYGFDLEGRLIFKAAPPEHYSFWYLSGKQIACNEADRYAVRSPRSGWWFLIDMNTGAFSMGAPAY